MHSQPKPQLNECSPSLYYVCLKGPTLFLDTFRKPFLPVGTLVKHATADKKPDHQNALLHCKNSMSACECTDVWIDGWMAGRLGGWMDGSIHNPYYTILYYTFLYHTRTGKWTPRLIDTDDDVETDAGFDEVVVVVVVVAVW